VLSELLVMELIADVPEQPSVHSEPEKLAANQSVTALPPRDQFKEIGDGQV